MAKFQDRINICIVGKTNAGKSSLLNLLSGQKDFAIVDAKPGTTADTVVSLMEIHGLGPVKLFDTAGIDEGGELGTKKRNKTFQAIDESDLCLLTIDSRRLLDPNDNFFDEKKIDSYISNKNKQALLIFNLFEEKQIDELKAKAEIFAKELNLPHLLINISDFANQSKLIDFILANFQYERKDIDLFPNLKNKGLVLLNIPMDEETPELRLLRPQDIVVERLLRNFIIPVLYRMNLKKARSANPDEVEEERQRFVDLLTTLNSSSEGLQLVVTDSQAFDIVGKWVPDDIPLTSFSITMTYFMTYGNMDYIIESTKKLDELQGNDLVLIAESCNHNRKCDDIGTQQLPRLLRNRYSPNLQFEFAFGRIFPDELEKYKMIIHCGSCMTDRQKYFARIQKAKEKGVPFTNYGMTISYSLNKDLFKRVLKPFNY